MNPRKRQRILLLVVAFVLFNPFGSIMAGSTSHPDVTKLVIYGRDPTYPEEARKRQERGTGVFLLRTDIQSGRVIQVIVGKTTGHPLLDDAAMKALLGWRFKPGALVHTDIHKPVLNPPVSKDQCLVMIPVTF